MFEAKGNYSQYLSYILTLHFPTKTKNRSTMSPLQPTGSPSHAWKMEEIDLQDDTELTASSNENDDPVWRRKDGNEYDVHGHDPKQCRRDMSIIAIGWGLVILLSTLLIVNRRRKMEPHGGFGPILDNRSDAKGMFAIRINCGASQAYYDSDNNTWLPDYDSSNATTDTYEFGKEYFYIEGVGGQYSLLDDANAIPSFVIANSGVEGTGLYRDERFFERQGIYHINVPWEGVYEVNLYFAEIFYSTVNQRRFDVYLEDNLFVENYDIVREAPGKKNLTSTRKTLTTAVTDGSLTIRFVSKLEHAKISGIGIQSVNAK